MSHLPGPPASPAGLTPGVATFYATHSSFDDILAIVIERDGAPFNSPREITLRELR
ncbi:hypothetical protein [Nonomuraea sp. B19D2]|uniref:hypothetical protein n=1 Tax=Nonomuraea sp. B19D2 TaxID=3159561 RepID=UPI0032DA1551